MFTPTTFSQRVQVYSYDSYNYPNANFENVMDI